MKTKLKLFLLWLVLGWLLPESAEAQPRTCFYRMHVQYVQSVRVQRTWLPDKWEKRVIETSDLEAGVYLTSRAIVASTNLISLYQSLWDGFGNAGEDSVCVVYPRVAYDITPPFRGSTNGWYTNVIDISNQEPLYQFDEHMIGSYSWKLDEDTRETWTGSVTFVIDNTSVNTPYLVRFYCEGDKGDYRWPIRIGANQRIFFTPTVSGIRNWEQSGKKYHWFRVYHIDFTSLLW